MNFHKLAAAGLLVLAAGSSAAQAVSERKGMLTNCDGYTLYTFARDSAGRSHCNGPCAAVWPPFFARDDARSSGAFTVVRRDDGTTQWAQNGKPLYFYAPDTQPGDAKGDGQAGVWHVVRAGAARAATVNPATSYEYGYGGYRY